MEDLQDEKGNYEGRYIRTSGHEVMPDGVVFQHVETDMYVGFPPSHSASRNNRQARPIIRLYGSTKEGHSVLAHVIGFCPYFYVRAWHTFSPGTGDCEKFKQALSDALKTDQSNKHKTEKYVVKVSVVEKQTLWGYHFKRKDMFLKVYLTLPNHVPACRRILKCGINIPGVGVQAFESFESNMPFILRYMIDVKITGSGWINIPSQKYSVVERDLKTSHCTHEVIVPWNQTGPYITEEGTEPSDIAPFRILSFDIECSCTEGFPDPKRQSDKVIQIANVLQMQGQRKPFYQSVFCLNSCAPIAGAVVHSFETEKEMLRAWVRFVQESDPDILTGYNIVNFDLPYLLDRAEFLKVSTFPYLGRIKNSRSIMKDSTFSSRAYGTSNSKDIKIEGRVQMDLLPIIRREYKLRSYSLNNVSFHFLKQQKEDVHYSIIGDLQNGDEQTRRRLAVYCLKDAVLPLRLCDKLMFLINHIEMARVTGVPISFLISRGQQIKVLSQLYRKAQDKDLLIPYRERVQDEETFDGAIVIEPTRGFYQTPITTLDFASLYPSIMMAHNLCYTTMISKADASRMSADEYTLTPTGNYFVTPKVQKGLLPEILDELLSARKKAKKDMKSATDPFKKSVLNGRQLALKISANSVYGFTGATVGSLPCLSISASVTGFGREMIAATKNVVEDTYCMKNGYAHDARVIYGDTDSVMIKFGVSDMKEAMKLGEEAAVLVSNQFKDPIRLEFEKVYLPYLLMNKKRYAGMLWTKPDQYDYMDAKGIETVRRDNCELVKNVVQTVLDYILIDRDVKKAEAYTKSVISKLLQNKVDMSLLVITKALGKLSDYKVKIAHVELAQRMRKRDPRTAPKVGDRVAYVLIKGPKGAKAYEKAEDPLYALENGIPLDTDYYLQHQLSKPLTRIFDPILGDKINTLFAGRHTRRIKVSTSKVGAMSRFTVVKKTCLGCKVHLKAHQASVCDHCKSKEAQLYMEYMSRVREHENRFYRLWTQCQRCQGSMTQEVLCSNRDCPIFYRRTKERKDLQNARKSLEQFTF